MNNKKFGALSSSVDPNKLSLTVESIIKGVIGLVGWIAAVKGIDGGPATDYLQQLQNMVLIAIPAGFTVYNSLTGVWGLVRKIMVWVTTVRDPYADGGAGGVA